MPAGPDTTAMQLKQRLAQLNLKLPPVAPAVADYIPALRVGNFVYVSGQLCMRDGSLMACGAVPSQVTLADAQAAARQCALNALAAVDHVLEGDWSNFQQIVRLGVFVYSDSDFDQQHQVANGASELLGQIFAEQGKHVRAAVGAASLPLGATVEAELVVALK